MNMQNTANMSIKRIHHLEAAGFSRPQAEGIARANAEATGNLVTKQYADEHLLTKEYAAKYLVTKEYLERELEKLEAKIDAKIADVRTDIATLRAEMMRMHLYTASFIGGLIALFEFLGGG